MTTLIAKLCALCAVGTILELTPGLGTQRSGFRLVCGVLMLRLTMQSVFELIAAIQDANGLTDMLSLLVG